MINGWFGFWIFLSVVTICLLISDYLEYQRERWIIKQGYSYDKKRKVWVKSININIDDDNNVTIYQKGD